MQGGADQHVHRDHHGQARHLPALPVRQGSREGRLCCRTFKQFLYVLLTHFQTVLEMFQLKLNGSFSEKALRKINDEKTPIESRVLVSHKNQMVLKIV